ncbi:MAG: phosphatase PAP2 family protein [Erysipelotrichaceae bacterium]|nr:phosphatase PAP2 family protein [Erysipelotrichaceae bacterium]
MTKRGMTMKKFAEKIKQIPKWGWASGIGLFVLQYSMYRFANWVSVLIGTAEHAFECKIPVIDDLIPIIPVFVLPYIASYGLWVIAPAAASLTKKRNYINYVCGLLATYIIGSLIFILWPTYMDRAKEGLMAYAQQPGLMNMLLGVVYAADGSERAFNLFPSFHCIISAYCYLGVRKQPEISKGYQMFSLLAAVLICFSTVFTKQHYIIDVIGGIAISLAVYVLMNLIDPGRRMEEKKK